MILLIIYFNIGLNEVFVYRRFFQTFFLFLQSEKDYDPFADRRRPTVAEKEDEYRQKRRRMIISPERVDPFAEGLYGGIKSLSYTLYLLWLDMYLGLHWKHYFLIVP